MQMKNQKPISEKLTAGFNFYSNTVLNFYR